jgi:hypothetical protein
MGVERVETLRLWVLAVLLIGLLGTLVELVLLGHFEEPIQLVPVVLLVAGGGVLVWHARRPSAVSRMSVVVAMSLFVLSGFLGFVAHFSGSAEFQLEMNPTMGTWELVGRVLQVKAPPLLAPGMMIQLGLLGLAYRFSDSFGNRSNAK